MAELFGVDRHTMSKRLTGINLYNTMEVLKYVSINSRA